MTMHDVIQGKLAEAGEKGGSKTQQKQKQKQKKKKREGY